MHQPHVGRSAEVTCRSTQHECIHDNLNGCGRFMLLKTSKTRRSKDRTEQTMYKKEKNKRYLVAQQQCLQKQCTMQRSYANLYAVSHLYSELQSTSAIDTQSTTHQKPAPGKAYLTGAASAALAQRRIGVWPGDAERWTPEVVDATVVLGAGARVALGNWIGHGGDERGEESCEDD